jgi:hypothetical protein
MTTSLVSLEAVTVEYWHFFGNLWFSLGLVQPYTAYPKMAGFSRPCYCHSMTFLPSARLAIK